MSPSGSSENESDIASKGYRYFNNKYLDQFHFTISMKPISKAKIVSVFDCCEHSLNGAIPD